MAAFMDDLADFFSRLARGLQAFAAAWRDGDLNETRARVGWRA